MIEHFSKRRHEMQREAEEGGIGLATKASAERSALATRERKQYGLETYSWRDEVRAYAAELGLGTQETTHLPQQSSERSHRLAAGDSVDEDALGDVLAGADGLTERAKRSVLQAFAEAAHQGALVPEVRGQSARFTERSDILRTARGEMTTAELVSCERRIIASAIGRISEGTGIVDSALTERVLAAANRPLTAEQATAVHNIVSTGHGVNVIQALAGTGKTYTAGVLRQVVIAIGDPGQLASVQAGGWLAAIGHAVDVIRLTEVMRQRDPAERRALAALHDHQPHSYLKWASNTGRIQTFSDPATVCAQAIQEWANAAADLAPGQAVMIARDNDTRDTLNRTARELRHELGQLGDQRSYDTLELAVGDRVICRHNDRVLDVDNGMRGTVRHLDTDRVVIDTDSRLLRELSATYAAEHLEHAYALTGHGMQGGTVETATVVASPHDLTAGWSYTALSRARGHTQLLIYEHSHTEERSEFAPTQQAPPTSRNDLLGRVAQRMLERDDEDLAIEQLSGAGRSDDHTLTDAERITEIPRQEQAATHAGAIRATSTLERLHELRDAIAQLRTQASALPTRQLQRVDDLEARAVTLSTQREHLDRRLNDLAQPHRRFGREHDPSPVERAHLTNATQSTSRELDTVLKQRARIEHELGNPSEIRAEHDALQRTLTQLTRQHREIRDELAEREVQAPSEWAIRALGERPTEPHTRNQWEQAVRHAARYRHQYDITDPNTPLGHPPEDQEHQRDWRRTLAAVGRNTQRLDFDVDADSSIEISR